jgi:uncharacterized membrane protein YGL010W
MPEDRTMKTIEENLTRYAAYHRDRRNIATHGVGVPMIVFAVVLALATISIPAGSLGLTAAALVCLAASIYYLRQDPVLGLTLAIALLLMCAASSEIIARTSTGAALWVALGVFAVGWALQFLGHRFEGMKPAFFDDVMQLLIGPLFVCAEFFFMFGAKQKLRRYIEERVGPTVVKPGVRLPSTRRAP